MTRALPLAEQGYCRNLALDEALAGTAPAGVRRWILIEDGRPWGARPPADSQLPAAVQAWILERSARPGTRVVLIRKPGQSTGARRKVFLVEAGEDPAARSLLSAELELGELASLDDEQLLARMRPLDGLLWLVCTHGARDRCCAKWGLPLWSAMAAQDPENVWQSAHLGGHRFAPMALALPLGALWGRLELDEVPGLMAGVAAGSLAPLERLRGRCVHSTPAQAAECLLRLAEGLDGDAQLRLREQLAADEDGRHLVRFSDASGAERSIRIVQREDPTLVTPGSCGDEPAIRSRWIVDSCAM
ncbi:hypothetical protein G6O69_28750 [Pseudenhygromyxa sp. WMMC2535]|uniref:sucrase ferredoxin n=1 Tax=Pseudenhygromyxa sp. WMMC2535 TaxID=2712867 RepID=UPI001554EB4A|nr:sucrase ferredoxin [Pseudenhygromyxa sp. WMMC2535]NVB41856.1 hypothetical protein [Pseudenhygromyxa sp. WMMC2535]